MNKDFELFIFSDFDGTITTKDIGDEIFKEFGIFEPYHTLLQEGKLKITDYWNIVISKLNKGITEQTIIDFALNSEIDSHFTDFIKFCRERSIPFTVISDGFDVYINPILKKAGCSEITVYCNNLIFTKDNKPKPNFPMASESCNCLCASCKRNAILTNIPENPIIVFIGDGYSDYCAVEHADIIFAKKSLAAYCNENKIPHYPFSTFYDIQKIFNDIILKKKQKIRNQAKILRNKAFLIE